MKPPFMRLTFVLGLLLVGVLLHAQTYERYNDSTGSTLADASQRTNAPLAKASRPAELDPEGNWGKPVDGIQLSLRLDKSEYTNGEPIVVTKIIRNVCWARRTFRYGRQELVLRDAEGKPIRWKSKDFEDWSKLRRGPDWELAIDPQMQWRSKTTISTNMDFPLNSDISVQLIQRLPVSVRNVSNVVESAFAKFRIVNGTADAKNASSGDGHAVK